MIQTRFRFWKKVDGEFLSENFMDLVGKMLLPDSVFTAKDIRAHKWMKNDISESSISDFSVSFQNDKYFKKLMAEINDI